MYCRLADACTYDFMAHFHPSVDDLHECGESFHVFKEYMKAGIIANAHSGIHKMEEVEDSEDVYRMNITNCAFHAIPNKIGLGDACLSSCYGDEVFYPRYCGQFNVEFIREGTIARGDKVCDFCFKRKSSNKEVRR